MRSTHEFIATFLLVIGLLLPVASPAEEPAALTLRDVIFTSYDPSTSLPELLRRLRSPLTGARLEWEAAAAGKSLAGRTIDLASERFIVRVPSSRPAGGYGLLVFVPPWQDARIPAGWAAELDRAGLLFVSAARSGNDESPLTRRAPLALLAAHNLIHQYAVDPERVYIAGFSGGSRIALRLALGYGDLFRGAILNAGSDPIGTRDVPLPPRELLRRFQDTVHLVYVTGARDEDHVMADSMSLRSMTAWCQFNTSSFLQPLIAHEVAPASALARAFGLLAAMPSADTTRAESCRARVEAALTAKLEHLQTLVTSASWPMARKALIAMDDEFAGLAAPRSVDLNAAIQAAGH